MYNRKTPIFDIIVHIFVYFDNLYGISNNIAEETKKAEKKASGLLKIFAYITLFFQYTAWLIPCRV